MRILIVKIRFFVELAYGTELLTVTAVREFRVIFQFFVGFLLKTPHWSEVKFGLVFDFKSKSRF